MKNLKYINRLNLKENKFTMSTIRNPHISNNNSNSNSILNHRPPQNNQRNTSLWKKITTIVGSNSKNHLLKTSLLKFLIPLLSHTNIKKPNQAQVKEKSQEHNCKK